MSGFYETRNERSLTPPEPDPMPVCPECGAECEWYYRNQIGEIIGCENCIDSLDAYAYEEERRNGN